MCYDTYYRFWHLHRVFFFAEKIHVIFKYAKKLHWRQGVLLMEIVILFFCWIHAKTPGSAGYRAGIVCMCNAGTDVPEK